MTDLLSPSPWTDRQDYLREHPPLSHSAALARIDALEAQFALAEMGIAVDESMVHEVIAQQCLDAERARDAALARNAELEAALEPLAALASAEETRYENCIIGDLACVVVFMRDLRRARSALRNR